MAEERTEYSARDLGNVVGVSRSTLRYYEKSGLLNPDRKEGSAYRAYGNEDLNSLVSFYFLRNCGYETDEAVEQIAKPYANIDDYVRACEGLNAKRKAWHEAIALELERIGRIYGRHAHGVPFVTQVQKYLFYTNQIPLSHRVSDSDPARAALFQGSPVATTSCLLNEPDSEVQMRWGNAIPERHAHLFPELARDYSRPVVFEGGPCVCHCFCLPIDHGQAFVPSEEAWGAMAAFAERRRFRLGWPCLLVDYIPVGDTVYATVCQPAEGADLLARADLARLARQG